MLPPTLAGILKALSFYENDGNYPAKSEMPDVVQSLGILSEVLQIMENIPSLTIDDYLMFMSPRRKIKSMISNVNESIAVTGISFNWVEDYNKNYRKIYSCSNVPVITGRYVICIYLFVYMSIRTYFKYILITRVI